jgi:hypothetical protein
MTTALEGGEWSAARPDHTLPPGKTRHPLYRRLGGPQGRSGQVQKISPPPGFYPRTVQPVVILRQENQNTRARTWSSASLSTKIPWDWTLASVTWSWWLTAWAMTLPCTPNPKVQADKDSNHPNYTITYIRHWFLAFNCTVLNEFKFSKKKKLKKTESWGSGVGSNPSTGKRFFFYRMSRLALLTTQPPMLWVLGFLPRGKETGTKVSSIQAQGWKQVQLYLSSLSIPLEKLYYRRRKWNQYHDWMFHWTLPSVTPSVPLVPKVK